MAYSDEPYFNFDFDPPAAAHSTAGKTELCHKLQEYIAKTPLTHAHPQHVIADRLFKKFVLYLSFGMVHFAKILSTFHDYALYFEIEEYIFEPLKNKEVSFADPKFPFYETSLFVYHHYGKLLNSKNNFSPPFKTILLEARRYYKYYIEPISMSVKICQKHIHEILIRQVIRDIEQDLLHIPETQKRAIAKPTEYLFELKQNLAISAYHSAKHLEGCESAIEIYNCFLKFPLKKEILNIINQFIILYFIYIICESVHQTPLMQTAEKDYRKQKVELRPIHVHQVVTSHALNIGASGYFPATHHIIWAGIEMPETYKLALVRCVAINQNNGWEHVLWWCPDMLPVSAQRNMEIFAQRNRITLNNILAYQFENQILIHQHLANHDFARMSDILRLEEAFSGLYTDTDIEYLRPLPSSEMIAAKLKRGYGIITSEEREQIGISNSLLARPYGCSIMAACREAVRKKFDPSLMKMTLQSTLEFLHHKADDIKVLHETGPLLLSRMIAEVIFNYSGDNACNLHLIASEIKPDFEKLIFTRIFPNMLQIRTDGTWLEEGRKKFQTNEYRLREHIKKIRAWTMASRKN